MDIFLNKSVMQVYAYPYIQKRYVSNTKTEFILRRLMQLYIYKFVMHSQGLSPLIMGTKSNAIQNVKVDFSLICLYFSRYCVSFFSRCFHFRRIGWMLWDFKSFYSRACAPSPTLVAFRKLPVRCQKKPN